MKTKGAIAAGHPETARAAGAILEEGGNAFDAALAAMCVACVAEPVLASLGGGGFLLARRGAGEIDVFDFFTHTPKRQRAEAEVEFFPVLADFGTATQEFHIGMGSMATPGAVKGLFEAHRALASMPMSRIVEPAVSLARRGVPINRLQAYILGVVGRIYVSNAECRALFGGADENDRPTGEGGELRMPAFADTLEALAREGEDLFYRGEVARRIAEDCRTGGGLLSMDDLACYGVERRRPLTIAALGARLFTNPPPSSGGILIAFALELLRGENPRALGFGSAAYVERLADVMAMTNKARLESRLHEHDAANAAETLLDPDLLAVYRREVRGHPAASRGTTHISIIDAGGNAASLSLSNGEGSAYIVPGTGIMLNNMLGEEDINVGGFHQWPEDARMSSMMAPSLIVGDAGDMVAMGSGGSNRIRTALLQVMLNLRAFDMPLAQAVGSPRLHFEEGLLSIEDDFGEAESAALAQAFPDAELWAERNMFFGGVHAVRFEPATKHFDGAGDPRRGGVTVIA
ncbi:MAG: gamma-glutamyltransferase [Rhodospirillales bacterium]|jgi:gamma-glutamyltranspeptidase/glutathione hydrolase|nr:gamma-glutamyltransferase [Rhodospirillales bacterium]MDP6773029.1 gamma-glutamyltransferase [Rhodospirillales bacterium]